MNTAASIPPADTQCAICCSPLQPTEELVACPECRAMYHAECWQHNGGCAIYGCRRVPTTEHRDTIEIPPAYWGQENKPCPACGRTILAAAIRCRFCGATFDSAQPENAEGFRRHQETSRNLPGLCRNAVWLFVWCVLPLTAPVAAWFAVVWHQNHRDDLAAMPSMHAALARLALFIGLGQTAMLIVMAILFAATRAG